MIVALPSAPRRAWSSLIPEARFLGAVVVEIYSLSPSVPPPEPYLTCPLSGCREGVPPF
jgi:hypothetical protein